MYMNRLHRPLLFSVTMARLVPCLYVINLAVLFGASSATSPPEAYWKSLLPNTPLPNAISEFLLPVDKRNTVDGSLQPFSHYTYISSHKEAEDKHTIIKLNAHETGKKDTTEIIWPSGYQYANHDSLQTTGEKTYKDASKTTWPSGYQYANHDSLQTTGEKTYKDASKTTWPSGYQYANHDSLQTTGDKTYKDASRTTWPSGYQYATQDRFKTTGDKTYKDASRTTWPSGYQYANHDSFQTTGEKTYKDASRTTWPSGYQYANHDKFQTTGEKTYKDASKTTWPSGYQYFNRKHLQTTRGEKTYKNPSEVVRPSTYQYINHKNLQTRGQKTYRDASETAWPSSYSYVNPDNLQTHKDVSGIAWPSGYMYKTEGKNTDQAASKPVWPSSYTYNVKADGKKPEDVKADQSSLHNNVRREDDLFARYFLEKDLLLPGANLTKHFMRFFSNMEVLPRGVADSIPFSPAELPEILARFGVAPESVMAEMMKESLQDCFSPPIKREAKTCATSLESMVDFVRTTLATDKLSALSTRVIKEGSPLQQYKVRSLRKLAESEAIICHPTVWPYLVFKCHTGGGLVKAYMVSMVGEDDETTAEAVAVCHVDTSWWDPEFEAFRTLKVKPGASPICHLLPQEHLLWIPKGQQSLVLSA